MKFGDWFEKEGIICNNHFTPSKTLPEKELMPLFELSGDFDSDIVALCATLLGIATTGYGPMYKYPLFLDGKKLGTTQYLDQDSICALLSVQETADILLSKIDKGAISTLAFKLLHTDMDDPMKVGTK